MRGHVLWYRPQQRAGLIGADNGSKWSFRIENEGTDFGLQGGDEVEFEPQSNGYRHEARQLKLVRRWADALNEKHRSLVNEFHSTVTIVH